MGKVALDSDRPPIRAAARSTNDATVEFYESHADEYFERTVLADLSTFYERFLRHVKPGGLILDAGCGSGRDLKALHSHGFEVLGIDASPKLASIASKFSGVQCLPIRFEDISFRKRFDGVWACASLLHIPKRKIHPVLHRLDRSLIPGGALFVSLRLGQGEAFTDDGRFFAYYTCDEVRALFDKAGFLIDDLWVSQDTLPGREGIEWINVIALKPGAQSASKRSFSPNRH
jgi:SAM-dependent methyltransferase